jgi:steroid 5-alpha reductase family enzyme
MSTVSIHPTFQWPIQFCVATTVTVYALSLITGNVSQVDRVWTFLPTIYTAYWALLPLWPTQLVMFWPYTPKELPLYLKEQYSPRALLMLSLVVLWMVRLSYNTWRRGLFNVNEEDYRWSVLRQKVPTWFFQFTNLTFISIAQNIILMLLGLPTHAAALQPHSPLAISDYILFSLGLLTLACEFTADNQQYAFQTFKHGGYKKKEQKEWPGAQIRWTEEDVKRGFITKGLWAWSRHPNFLCEQTFWIIINAIPLLSPSSPWLSTLPSLKYSPTPLYPLLPAIVLCTLFFSSTLFTESISRSKYPEAYGMYQERVAMFVPFLTPVWGAWADFKGRKEVLDVALWGKVKGKKGKKE